LLAEGCRRNEARRAALECEVMAATAASFAKGGRALEKVHQALVKRASGEEAE
jgi:hypothetical protein